MKSYPYDINSLEDFNQIRDTSLTTFKLDRRRKIWNLIADELIKINFTNMLAKEIFTTISLQLFNHLPSIYAP